MRVPGAFAACVCALVSLAPCDSEAIDEAGKPRQYVDLEHGFSLEIPAGWTTASGLEFERLLRPLVSAEALARMELVLLIQQGDTSSLHYPCVFVTALRYDPAGPPSEEGMLDLAEQLRDIHERRQSRPPLGNVPELVEKRRLEDIQVFPTKRTFTFAMVKEIEGVGTIRTLSYGHFGGRCVLQLACGAFDADFEQYKPVFQRIDGSFAFQPGHEYKRPNGNGGSAVSLYSLTEVLCVAVCVLVLIGKYAKRRHVGAREAQRPPGHSGS
jgi:hypothetical protein